MKVTNDPSYEIIWFENLSKLFYTRSLKLELEYMARAA